MLTESNTYTKRVIRTIKDQMKQDDLTFNNNPKEPFQLLHIELNLIHSRFATKLNPFITYNFFGILRRMCEIEHIDIVYETAILSRYSIQPRTGHLEQLLYIFHYLDKHDHSWLPIDSRKLNINWNG